MNTSVDVDWNAHRGESVAPAHGFSSDAKWPSEGKVSSMGLLQGLCRELAQALVGLTGSEKQFYLGNNEKRISGSG